PECEICHRLNIPIITHPPYSVKDAGRRREKGDTELFPFCHKSFAFCRSSRSGGSHGPPSPAEARYQKAVRRRRKEASSQSSVSTKSQDGTDRPAKRFPSASATIT